MSLYKGKYLRKSENTLAKLLNLLQNYLANFNQSRHKASSDEGDWKKRFKLIQNIRPKSDVINNQKWLKWLKIKFEIGVSIQCHRYVVCKLTIDILNAYIKCVKRMCNNIHIQQMCFENVFFAGIVNISCL